jgi:hypothetical protein
LFFTYEQDIFLNGQKHAHECCSCSSPLWLITWASLLKEDVEGQAAPFKPLAHEETRLMFRSNFSEGSKGAACPFSMPLFALFVSRFFFLSPRTRKSQLEM